MTTVREDKKILRELDFFLQNDSNVYFNFKRNITAAYQMALTSEAERDFLKGNTKDYFCYAPFTQNARAFTDYCRLENILGEPYYYIRKDGRLSSVFCVNGAGVITQKKHYFNLDEMADVYHSFESKLQRCKPMEQIGQTKTNVPIFAIAKGAVAV